MIRDGAFDFVIATDVVYEDAVVRPLVTTAAGLLRPGGAFILANHEHRYVGLRDQVREAALSHAGLKKLWT